MKRPAKSAIELYGRGRLPASTRSSIHACRILHGIDPVRPRLPVLLGGHEPSAFAYDHRAPAALAVALLFGWMMYWQSLFVQKFTPNYRARLRQRWRSKEARRLGFLQLAVQPTKFLVLPLASLVLLPFASVYAFYQNLMAVRDGDSAPPGNRRGFGSHRTGRCSRSWPCWKWWYS